MPAPRNPFGTVFGDEPDVVVVVPPPVTPLPVSPPGLSQASRLFARGQQFLASQFPAKIKINGQSYDCATSGLRKSQQFGDGLGEINRSVSFWLPKAAFAAAGQALPRENVPLFWESVEYLIAQVSVDPTGTTLTLQCSEHPL